MPRPLPIPLHPAMLPPGTVVGSWRLVALAGCGTHGAVYRALPGDDAHAPAVALKLALHPGDPRFAREVELLSRTHHPSVPRWVDSGTWQHPAGSLHPFAVLEWVDGMPLYPWAQLHPPTARRVLELLAQLAGALAAIHAHGGVHRDVKGGNVLVRHSDGRAMLTDFGVGHYPGAATLTPAGAYPGTPAYRSPQLDLLAWPWRRGCTERHRAGPADDVYALGVTACRLVTGQYPLLAESRSGWRAFWGPNPVRVPPTLNHAEPRLRELILRMLSVRPEGRGTAEQLAEALEQAAASASPQSFAPQLPEPPVETRVPAKSAASRAWRAPRKGAERWFVAVACVLVLVAWVGWLAFAGSAEPQAAARAETRAGQKDAGTTALGEAAATLSQKESPVASAEEVLAEESLPEPLLGQIEPDAKGRCPNKHQIALNGGCWVPEMREGEACEALNGQLYKGTCYVPIIDRPRKRPRPPTSGPTKRSTRR